MNKDCFNLSKKYIKMYRKRSISIVLSMILSIALIVGIGSLLETARYTEIQNMRYTQGIYHVIFSDLNKKQIKRIEDKTNIANMGLKVHYAATSKEEKQLVELTLVNEDYIKSDSEIIKGRFPNKKNEMIAESWVLKNLSIKPDINQEIELKVKDDKKGFKKEKFKIVGILKDRESHKAIANMELMLPLDLYNMNKINTYIAFKNNIDINNEINKIAKENSIPKENIRPHNDLIGLETSENKEIYNKFKIVLVVSLICGIVIYGIFNISIYNRMGEYGVLRAIGTNRNDMFKVILQELRILYFISIPIGIITGYLGAKIFYKLGENTNTKFILNGEIIKIGLIFPEDIIILSILSIGVIIILIAFLTCRNIMNNTIISLIKRSNDNVFERNFVSFSFFNRFVEFSKAISLKNIFRNKKTFFMIILSMCICGTMFVLLNYNRYLKEKRYPVYFSNLHMNSDFMMNIYNDNKSSGINESILEEIEKIEGIKNIESSQVTYSKLIMNNVKILNKDYFNDLNYYNKDTPKKEYLMNDKVRKETILKNNFRGYNDNALNRLKDYIIEGNIDINKIKENNLAIVYIPQINGKNPVPQVNGKSVVDIKPGDEISIKFRKDNIIDDKYYKLTDYDSEYVYKQFKVGAIVSYDYMHEAYNTTSNSVDVIVDQETFKASTGINDYYSVNINLDKGANDKNIEDKISKIISKSNSKRIILTNIVKQKQDVETLNKKIKIYNTGIVFIIFIITIINVINNIGYSIISRINEFGILIAIGANQKILNKMIVYEGISYGVLSSLITIILSCILQKGIYLNSGVSSLGIEFSLLYWDYILITAVNIIIGAVTAHLQFKHIKSKRVVECINGIE